MTLTLNQITPTLLDKVLQRKLHSKNYARKTIKSILTVIRGFVKYAEDKGWCQRNLSILIKSPRIYKHESLPYAPSWENIKEIFATIEQRSPREIRDYAILMLLSVYGIRSGEVSRLRLGDIDWRNETIRFRRSKSLKSQIFPLSKPVGEAVLKYMKDFRPNNRPSREIFLCMRAPYQPVTKSVIYAAVSSKLKAVNLKLKHYGPHVLRHACATHLINEGVSLKEIAGHLGHQDLNTTRLYAKVDLNSLCKITKFKLGELL